MSATANPYTLVRPCVNCPFRTDVPGYLRRARAREIAEALANGAEFPCHKTTVEGEVEGDDCVIEEMLVAGPESKFCAGALICMEKQGSANQMMRISENLGLYDAERLDMDAPVFANFSVFIDHHGDAMDGEEDEDRTCSYVGPGCEAPAGYLVGGMAIPGEGGDVEPCPVCGENVCGSCAVEGGKCPGCAEWGD